MNMIMSKLREYNHLQQKKTTGFFWVILTSILETWVAFGYLVLEGMKPLEFILLLITHKFDNLKYFWCLQDTYLIYMCFLCESKIW